MTVSDLSVAEAYGLMVLAHVNVLLVLLGISRLWPTLEYKQMPIFFIGIGGAILLPIYLGISAITAPH